ncbi:hypothetical protein JEQ12_019295 [Ovis aries]|uniref:Uncharacterized protein n=1 Tax=Ovis aries TaxID=9940 RepID=A0A836ACB9_SHEEP|nr:hypothetical protein JEQ12_019295 [Ovis aries]
MDYIACQVSLSVTNSQSLLKFMSIKSVMPSNHLILCLSLLLPSILPSIRVFSNESVLHIRWPNYWSFSISPSSEYSGLISFRMGWFDLAVQGTLKSSTPQFKSISSLMRSLLYGPPRSTQTVKHLSTMRETRVRSLGWEDPLEKEMAIHSRTIAWKIPWTEEPGRLQSMGSQRVRHN